MELIIPFMLFLLETPLDDPSRAELTRHPFLFADEEQCQAAVQNFKTRPPLVTPEEPTQIKYFCQAVPQPPEYERLFSEMDAARRARIEAESE
ncbi:hypothetical protein FGU71_11785 [Erythrobacter insulae]|uniref:Uncharacterized protein n=1 Tax=Erythrobacter insulae TaxID=2584124 RepID=A0A547PEA8_9SPHN|nr:hypothetical protein [Erythrobacter insulae]TRD12475.1 hypothetical protein FGU71_11785 [Erythrobacter insulae]